MATYNKFQDFIGFLGLKHYNLNTDTINVYAAPTASAPSASADSVKGDCAGITVEHGYDVADIQNLFSEATGTGTMTATDVVWTASGGSFGPLQYVLAYNSTVTDELMAWWDYASAVTVLTGETFTVDFGASVFTIA
jgi:hypothetical protein